MTPPIDKLIAILQGAAREELLPRFSRVDSELKADGSLVTEADTRMQQRVSETLQANWPDIPLLGEEMSSAEQQALLDDSEKGLWLLDPLDGTSNFAAGIPFFCVSLALVRHGKVEIGVIYDPLRNECFAARRGEGAQLNGQRLRVSAPGTDLLPCMGLVDFKRLAPSLATRLVSTPPYASQRSFGSGALDWCMIAAGRCQLYLHGGQKLWDYAAGQLILNEAGGRSGTLQGWEVFENSLATRSVVAASTPGLFTEWRHWLEAG